MPDLRPVVKDAHMLALLNERFSTPVTDLVPVEVGAVARTFAFRAGSQDYIIRFNLNKMLTSTCFISDHSAPFSKSETNLTSAFCSDCIGYQVDLMRGDFYLG